jgi:hypothetical protein
LDLPIAARNIERSSGVIAVELDATKINLEGSALGDGAIGGTLSREEIERASINRLVADEHLWGLDGEQENIASLLFELKESVRADRSPDELAELIQASSLIEKIRITMNTAGELKIGAPPESTPVGGVI